MSSSVAITCLASLEVRRTSSIPSAALFASSSNFLTIRQAAIAVARTASVMITTHTCTIVLIHPSFPVEGGAFRRAADDHRRQTLMAATNGPRYRPKFCSERECHEAPSTSSVDAFVRRMQMKSSAGWTWIGGKLESFSARVLDWAGGGPAFISALLVLVL